MADFTHLQGLRVGNDATAEFTFYGIAGEPTLEVRPATESNREFFNAALKRSKHAGRRQRGRKSIPTPETIEQARQEDILLFSKYIVKSWPVPPVDSAGEPVEFSPEVVAQFLDAIPSDMFTELRVFCLEIDNFREDLMDPDDQEELGKS